MINLLIRVFGAGVLLGMVALIACGGSDPSAVDENKEIVSRFVEEFKNNANHDIVDELFTLISFTISRIPTYLLVARPSSYWANRL